jgi:hypothetical protein
MNKMVIKLICVLCLIWFNSAETAYADYKDDIGFTALSNELGQNIPTGTGIHFTQVEAFDNAVDDPNEIYWMPDTSQFNKTFYDKSTGHPTGSSVHATSVGNYLYGAGSSIAPGSSDIDVYLAGNGSTGTPWGWLLEGFLIPALFNVQPLYDRPEYPDPGCFPALDYTSPSRVANHSWVGSSSTSDLLRRVDFVVEADEFIQVAALNQGSTNRPLLASAFNVISVGKTNTEHPRGSFAFVPEDLDYASGRAKPDLVVPLSATSYAAPVVAAAAALLLEVGHKGEFTLSEGSTTNRDGDLIYNAERAEAIKAILMAGADRFTRNVSSTDQIVDYRLLTGDQTNNGLDARVGAGQLNIQNSYHIIAAGEQNSIEEGGAGFIQVSGFDVDDSFGIAGQITDSAAYRFRTDEAHCRLAAALVWNIDINGGTCSSFIDSATLHDLNLYLYDVTDSPDGTLVASSTSGPENTENPEPSQNTENLWVALEKDKEYEIRVKPRSDQSDFSWDYALAWQLTADGDKDGLPDYWELMYTALNPENPDDGLEDPDADNLTNVDEYAYETNPTLADTDNDGIDDGPEVDVWAGLDCSSSGCSECRYCDIDGDNQANNLLDDDADGDGHLDGDEIGAGSDPADPQSVPVTHAVPALNTAGFIFGFLLLSLIGISFIKPKT